MPDNDQEAKPEEKEEGGFWKKAEQVGGVIADGVEIAGTAGSHLAEEVPLLATAYHGGMGVMHAAKMWNDGRQADSLGKMAGEPSANPEFDTGPGPILDASAKKRQEAMNEGAEAQEQFLEAVPLLGTAVGLGGTIAHAINPKIDPAKMLFGGKAENQAPDGAPVQKPDGAS